MEEPWRALDVAWAAGFFEGEGNVYVPPLNQGRGLRLSLAQSGSTTPACLSRFMAIVGGGSIGPLPANALSKKQRWGWRVQRREEAERILTMLRPHMTPGAKPVPSR